MEDEGSGVVFVGIERSSQWCLVLGSRPTKLELQNGRISSHPVTRSQSKKLLLERGVVVDVPELVGELEDFVVDGQVEREEESLRMLRAKKTQS